MKKGPKKALFEQSKDDIGTVRICKYVAVRGRLRQYLHLKLTTKLKTQD